VNDDLALLFLNRSYMSTIARPGVRGVERYKTRDLFFVTLWLDR
jgi:hypothetical protein